MTTTTERPLTPAARRVLDAACTLFYERGINTVGMDLIAATANVTKKTVYDRFGSKDALITAYLHKRDNAWRTWLGQRLGAVTDPRDRVLAVFDALAEWMGDDYRGCAMVHAHAEIADPRHPARIAARRQKQRTVDLYAALLTEADIHDDALALQLTMLHEGAVTAAAVGGVGDAVAAARAAVITLMDAHTPRSGTGPKAPPPTGAV